MAVARGFLASARRRRVGYADPHQAKVVQGNLGRLRKALGSPVGARPATKVELPACGHAPPSRTRGALKACVACTATGAPTAACLVRGATLGRITAEHTGVVRARRGRARFKRDRGRVRDLLGPIAARTAKKGARPTRGPAVGCRNDLARSSAERTALRWVGESERI